MCKKSLEMVALKVYHMENLCELNHYQVFREIRVHQSLQHQNIIHLFASFQVSWAGPANYRLLLSRPALRFQHR
jgi:serine/threonine protein kinase